MELKNIINEHIKWKHQIFKLAKADLKKTYNGAALGWSWAIIRPVFTIFIYWFAFYVGLRIKREVGGFPFIFWLISGIIPWFYIRDMWNTGPSIMRKYKHLVTKMKFPVSTIPTFVSLSKLLVHVALIIFVIGIFAASGYGLDKYMLQLPLYMFMMFIFFTSWGLFSSLLGAMSKDFGNLVQSFTLALFWLSGIMIPLTRIKSKTAIAILRLNPVTYIVNGYRNCFIDKVWFWEDLSFTYIFLGELLILVWLSLILFKKLRKELPDVL